MLFQKYLLSNTIILQFSFLFIQQLPTTYFYLFIHFLVSFWLTLTYSSQKTTKIPVSYKCMCVKYTQ